jgi:molybdopterin-guanine dinucleotide biosynthesis protein A
MTRRAVSAIVLAGGRSSRFGRDKLAESIDGRPLLEHAIDAVRPWADQIVVVIGPEGVPTRALPPGVLVARDPAPFEGPLVGLRSGLAVATNPIVLVAAGDTPVLVAAVIEALLGGLEDASVDAVTLGHGDRPWPFPMALRRIPAEAAAARLVDAGERRLLALPQALAARIIDEASWRALDPDGQTLHDIDTPDDLLKAHEDPRRRRDGGRRVLEGESRG